MYTSITLLLALIAAAIAAILPSNIGPYGTQITTMELTDHNRTDLYADDGRKRRLMLSLISPVSEQRHCQNTTANYMPALTANFYDQLYAPITQNGTFESFNLQTCEYTPSSRHQGRKRGPECRLSTPFPSMPIAIFSPGYGNSRLLYTALCQSVASYGFHIITIDHPYDALGTEYPDGTYVLGTANSTTDTDLERDIAIRVADVSFVIDSLSNNAIPLPHALTPIFMFGHSLGGASSLAAMFTDSRIAAGANIDGRLFNGALPAGTVLQKPFLLMGNQDRNSSTDETWDMAIKTHLAHPVEKQFPGTEHGSFTDLPLLIETAGIDSGLLSASENGIGSVQGSELVRELSRTVVDFFNDAMRE